jgi:hypothetical protein
MKKNLFCGRLSYERIKFKKNAGNLVLFILGNERVKSKRLRSKKRKNYFEEENKIEMRKNKRLNINGELKIVLKEHKKTLLYLDVFFIKLVVSYMIFFEK